MLLSVVSRCPPMLSIGIQRIDSTSCGFMEDSVMERENWSIRSLYLEPDKNYTGYFERL